MLEVGSVPGPTKVKMKLKDPHGKSSTLDSEVGVRLSQGLAKKKGIEVDKDGRVKSKGKLEETTDYTVPILVILAILAGGFIAFDFFTKQRNAGKEEEAEEAEEADSDEAAEEDVKKIASKKGKK